MKKNIKFACLSAVCIFALSSCKHDSTPPVIDETAIKDTVYFYDEVLPIVQSNCAISGCHTGGEEEPDLSNYSNILNMVKPGDPQNSRLYKYAIGSEMPPPPKTPLNLEQVTLIYGWIKQGALENMETCDTSIYTFAAATSPIIKRNCLGCHNTGSANGELTNHSQISAKATTILGRIKGQSGSIMPPSPAKPLSECKITKITNWINNGKQND
ncbi:MAG: hypothetical protein ACOYO1_07120 [Bacteroidales bacterium]